MIERNFWKPVGSGSRRLNVWVSDSKLRLRERLRPPRLRRRWPPELL